MVFIPKTNWSDEPSTATPITATELIRIENGIAEGQTSINALETSKSPIVHTHTQSDITDYTVGKNAPSTIPVFIHNPITQGVGTLKWYNDTNETLSILAVRASLTATHTGTAVVVDVNVNNVTIFTTQGNRPSIPAGSLTDLSGTVNSPLISPSSFVTVDVDSIGTHAGVDDLMVFVTVVPQ